MSQRSQKHTLIILGILSTISVGTLVFMLLNKNEIPEITTEATPILTTVIPVVAQVPPKVTKSEQYRIIGKSVEGRNIEAYIYGKGSTHIMFVGGIHGGYEWNSVLVAYELIDYLKKNPSVVPENITVSIIPSANPDGVYRVVKKEGRFSPLDVPNDQKLAESGRFNAHNVDLNRNFDCKWQPTSLWKNKVVSAGVKVFSEPEAVAIRDFVLKNNPASVIFWHSQANAVYASKCENGILPKTLEIMNVYARASGYTAIKSFDAYETTGDSEGWLASINIPSITVELKTHETVEWAQNLAGVKALLKYYEK